MKNQKQIKELEKEWATNKRWKGITRPYDAKKVLTLRGSYNIEYSVARHGAEKLWDKLNNQDFVAGLSGASS